MFPCFCRETISTILMEIDKDVGTSNNQITLLTCTGTLQDLRFSREGCMDFEELCGLDEESTGLGQLFSKDHNIDEEHFKRLETEQPESEMQQILEESRDCNMLDGSIKGLQDNAHIEEEVCDADMLEVNTERFCDNAHNLEEQMEHLKGLETEQPESERQQILEENRDCNILDGSTEKLRNNSQVHEEEFDPDMLEVNNVRLCDNGHTLEEEMELSLQAVVGENEIPKSSVGQQSVVTEVKLLETLSLRKEKRSNITEDHTVSSAKTPQSKFKHHPSGANSSYFSRLDSRSFVNFPYYFQNMVLLLIRMS